MPSRTPGAGLLVLVELGATWPRSLVESSPYAACRVLAEQEGEGPVAFAARVRTFATSMFPRHVALETAVLACNERADESAVSARRSIAQFLSSRRGRTRLIFAPAARAREALRRSLDALVAELCRSERAPQSGTTFSLEGSAGSDFSRVA